MILRTISIAAIVLLLASCRNTDKIETASSADSQPGVLKVEFTSLAEKPGEYLGKNISVEGKVVHVCMQSGKKLFITGENPDVMLYVAAGENIPKFPMELLGSEIIVEGTLTKANAGAMCEGEGMQMSGEEAGIAQGDTCATEKALASQPVLAELMMVYNKHTLVK